MKFDADFFTSTAGQWTLLAVAVALGTGAVIWQLQRRQTVPLAASNSSPRSVLPRVFERAGARFPEPSPAPAPAAEPRAPASAATAPPAEPEPSLTTALSLFTATRAAPSPTGPVAPYGRLIPCETVVTLESNRLATPVIGLVTDDVWENGRVIVPAGTEVHGQAALDHARERIAVDGSWVLVWRSRDANNGTELTVRGLALAREPFEGSDPPELQDGSAGLPGMIVRATGNRELKLLAASFLSAATAALQDTRANPGPWGEIAVPAATVRNATLAGSGAILRNYAEQMREAIARDGFFLRVPAGTPFYLYVTERLDLGQAHRPAHKPDLP